MKNLPKYKHNIGDIFIWPLTGSIYEITDFQDNKYDLVYIGPSTDSIGRTYTHSLNFDIELDIAYMKKKQFDKEMKEIIADG